MFVGGNTKYMKLYMVTKAQGFMIYIPGTETFLSDEMDLFLDPHE